MGESSSQNAVILRPARIASIDTQWYGVLGLIGRSYLVTCVVYLMFRDNRTAILGCMTLLMCLFLADKSGMFAGFWLNNLVGIGGTLGSLGGIAVGGLLLGSILTANDMSALEARARFTFGFAVGCAAAALLLGPAYGISKNQATPSWCLWACAITAGLWFMVHLISDVRPVRIIAQPLALAGHNVLLAYLISNMLPGLVNALEWSEAYGQLATSLPSAIARSAACGVLILLVSTGLNRAGFRLSL